ncbi:MAG: MBL fold metallo-hydrolase [Candidatus Moranbacteria bacterium]|nr:MBL fold metallo-hydrolase [Candidatus Moranbacteria bacterium]
MQKPLWLVVELILLVLIFFGGSLYFWKQNKQDSFEVVFLNVGQGDAILIQDGELQVLIDGGRDGKVLLDRLGRYVPFWDRVLEVVVATHPDSDHIGGLPAVLKNYQVEMVMTNGHTSDTETSRLFEKLAIEKAGQRKEIALGTEILFPSEAKLNFLYPLLPLPNKSVVETNEGSLVARLDVMDTSFLFTGDLPREEFALMSIEPVDVLKVAHHGSKYSSSGVFLDKVKPRDAVISVGQNSYGHPAGEVLKNLEERKIQIYRTDEEGDIVYRCEKATRQCVKK